MKRIILLYYFVCITTNVFCKGATSVYYLMYPCTNTTFSDSLISIVIGISNDYNDEWAPQPFLDIKIKNNSNKVLYFDLGNSYIFRNDEASSIYVPTATTVTHGQSIGIDVNVGNVANTIGVNGMVGNVLQGVNVGGSKGGSTSIATYSERYFSLPPQSTKTIQKIQLFTPEYEKLFSKILYYKNINKVMYKGGGYLCFAHKDPSFSKGDCIKYNEDNSPFKIGTYFTYSDKSDFSSLYALQSKLFAAAKIGLSMGWLNSVDVFSGVKEAETLDKVLPNWREYYYIILHTKPG